MQDGAPRDLYERPADRSIADFSGDANLIPVTIEPGSDGMARVTLGAIRLCLPSRGLPSGPAALAVRPSGLRIHVGPPGPGELTGRVAKAAYLGSHMEYGVTLEGVADDVFIVDPGVADLYAPGTPVGVAFAEGVVALVAA